MATVIETPKLKLLRVQEEWQFGDAAFNKVIDDADDKLVGVSHLNGAPHWRLWEANTLYSKNDVVKFPTLASHQYAVCLVGGTSGVVEPIINVTGTIFEEGGVTWQIQSLTEADIDGGSIRIWLGGGVYYTQGTPVIYASALYRCRTDHFSGTTFEGDIARWQEIKASIRLWESSKYYAKDDNVVYDNTLYSCNTSHTSESSFTATEEAKWDKVSGGGNGVEKWQPSKDYAEGSIIVVNDVLYRANKDHTSTTKFEDDIDNWNILNSSVQDWAEKIYYPAGSMVVVNGNLYKCNTGHTSSTAFATDVANWTSVGGSGIKEWQATYQYMEGDMVLYNNCIYQCSIQHKSSTAINFANWRTIYSSTQAWKKNIVYPVGTIVLYDREFYYCKTLHTSSDFESEVANWTHVGGDILLEDWASNEEYKLHQTVVYNNTLYRCNTAHVSSSDFSTDIANWTAIGGNGLRRYANKTLYLVGDTCLYNDNIYRCIARHTSSTNTPDPDSWSIVYSSVKEWQTRTEYLEGSTVLYNYEFYRCTNTHTSTTSFSSDMSNWKLVGEKGILKSWATSSSYEVGQVVVYNNMLYRCNSAHISSSSFGSDSSKWDALYASIQSWKTGVYYGVGSVVLYEDVLYKCNTGHTSSDFATDSAKWDLVYANIRKFEKDTFYKKGSVVIYNNILYKCLQDHTSNTENIKEHVIYTTPYYKDYFITADSSTSLPIEKSFNLGTTGQIVRVTFLQSSFTSDAMVFSAVALHTSMDGTDYTKLKQISGINQKGLVEFKICEVARYIKLEGLSLYGASSDNKVELHDLHVYEHNNYWAAIGDRHTYIEEWGEDNLYYINEIVEKDSHLYKCIYDHRSSNFSEDVNKYWVTILPNIFTWESKRRYVNGQYVNYDNKFYKCVQTHTSSDWIANEENWELMYSSLADWKAGNSYLTGDVVVYEDRIYQCLQANNNSTWIKTDYWKELSSSEDVRIEPWETKKYYPVGSYMEKDNQIYKCIVAHTADTWENETNNWQLVSGLRIWSANTLYKEGSLLYYNKKLYKVNNDFESGSEFDLENVTKINSDLQEWDANHSYIEDEVMLYDGQIYIARYDVTTGSTFDTFDLVKKINVKSWKKGTAYQVNDYIYYNNTLYRVNTAFVSSSIFDSTNLVSIAPSIFEADKDYKAGDIIQYSDDYYNVLLDFKSKNVFIKSKLEKCVPHSLTEKQIEEIISYYNPEFSGQTIFVVKDSAADHNALYRERDLTDYFESGEMSEAIADASFTGIFPGDYIVKSITVDGVTYTNKWIVGDLDYFLHSGDTELVTHHVVLFSDTRLGTSYMNSANNISGGYVGSYMWKTTIPKYSTAIINAFGANHVIQNYRDILSNANSNGASGAGAGWTGTTTGWAWTTVPCANLFTEPMVYGGRVASSSIFDVGVGCSRLAVFVHNKKLAHPRSGWYWTRAASASTHWAAVYSGGYAAASTASTVGGVRPFFLLR